MYVLGATNDTVFQYTLSTPFDISTASYSGLSFSHAGQEIYPYDFILNPGGTKMYIVGGENDTLFSYTLSTEGDISTASYDNVSFDFGSQDIAPFGIAFNKNGSKMYMVGRGSDAIFQYSTGL